MNAKNTEQPGCKRHGWLGGAPQGGSKPCPYCADEAESARVLNSVNLRPYVLKACEEVDASIFSGDVLHNDAERAQLRAYVERWLRAINEHEAQEG